MEKIVQEIIKNKRKCYFISPHLDDAAFSCGGLISSLAKETKVEVITVFTKAGKDKHSLSALSYLRQCGYSKKDLQKLYNLRKQEDRLLFKKLGVEVKHLGLLDALWRPKVKLDAFNKLASLFLADFRYIYPTHKWHISKGKISKSDRQNLIKLENILQKIVEEESVIFCPIGLGRHVDHIVTRQACANALNNVIYWEDSPYNLYHNYKDDFIKRNKLKRIEYKENQDIRKGMYFEYKTQYALLFNGKLNLKLPPERYFFNETSLRLKKENNFGKNNKVGIRKKRVTIAIAAYKAEGNIQKLINTLLDQKIDKDIIYNIVTHVDPSDDITREMSIALSGNRIKVISPKSRLGFAGSVENIFNYSGQADVVVLLNDDIVIEDLNVVQKLINTLQINPNTALVNGNPQPITSNTFIEKAIETSFKAYPLNFILYLFVRLYIRLNRLQPKTVLNPIWEVDLSTKQI